MAHWTEQDEVQETRDLEPNVEDCARALFGPGSYYISWRGAHLDSAMGKNKHADGLVWLPWQAELWLVEIEWKLGSNFFEQSRGLSKSKVDSEKIRSALKNALDQEKRILDGTVQSVKEGAVVDGIVSQTMGRYFRGDRFSSNIWILLGHSRGNAKEVLAEYKEEAEARWPGKNDKYYILSKARLYTSDHSCVLLLDQYSNSGQEVMRSVLVPAKMPQRAVAPTTTLNVPIGTNHAPVTAPIQPDAVRSPNVVGRAGQMFSALRAISPTVTRDDILLRIKNSLGSYSDFAVAWDHGGKEFMVLVGGERKKPSNACKLVMSNPPPKAGNVARKYGSFVRKSTGEAIATYGDVERSLSGALSGADRHSVLRQQQTASVDSERCTYFAEWNNNKARKFYDNVIQRQKLWDEFLEKRSLKPSDFKRLSEFPPKGVAGFMAYLTRNRIARRMPDDSFVISADTVNAIRIKIRDYKGWPNQTLHTNGG